MGYALYVRPGATPASMATTSAAVVAAGFPDAGSAMLPTIASGEPRHERLLAALRRAAGNADVTNVLPDLDALRRDPLLKRALWPKLRALRKATGVSLAQGVMPEAPAVLGNG